MPLPTSRSPSQPVSRPNVPKTDSEVWFSLLCNIVFVPFVILLIALVANQTISIRQNLVEAETTDPAEAPGFIGDVLF